MDLGFKILRSSFVFEVFSRFLERLGAWVWLFFFSRWCLLGLSVAFFEVDNRP